MRVVEKRQLLSAQEIDRTLQRVAHEIVEKSGGAKDLAFIGVRRRGVPLSQRLAKAIQGFARVDVPVGTLDITLYRDDLSTVGPHPIVQSTDIDFAVDDRDLVVVDDVLYTGRTIRAAMNGLVRSGAPEADTPVRFDRSRSPRTTRRSYVRRHERFKQAIPKSWKCASRKLMARSASCWSIAFLNF